MKLSAKQQKVIHFCHNNNGSITKKDAMDLINTHYCNGEKHVGDVLSRMVKSGLLRRIKPGVFQLGNDRKSEMEIKNQTKLF